VSATIPDLQRTTAP